ncbi:MAG: lipoyl domain-containing protein, partial [Gammaproteobacteria bacterium]|nr:lipoyl domain-containing protein [Gammaproteobacteria bacterium]
MRVEFRLPSLGADMDSATLTAWLKQPGDRITHGEPIVTVETAKGLIDVEAYETGQLVDLVVAPGTKLAVGAVLAHLEVEDRLATAAPAPAPPPAAAAPTPTPATATEAPLPAPSRPTAAR